MSQIDEKQKKAMELNEQIEKIISIEDPDLALKSMNDEQLFNFLKLYFTNESLNYDDEIAKRVEEYSSMLDKELENKPSHPYSPMLLESLIGLCKMGIMDELVVVANEANQKLRAKIESLDINNPQCSFYYQIELAQIFQFYLGKMAKELKNECKSRGLDEAKFMEQSFTAVANDLALPFEIDSFAGLTNYEKLKDIPIEKEAVMSFSKQTVDYTKPLIEGRVDPRLIVNYPSLMNHFLYFKFKIDSYQVVGKVIKIIGEGFKPEHLDLYKQLLTEVWYSETGRMMMMMLFQQQMEYTEQFMKSQGEGHGQGFDPSMISGMDPSMMQGMDPKNMHGMDPAMMENMMQGINPGVMEKMMEKMDPATLQQMMKGVDPGMINQMMQGFDPATMQKMMENFDPSAMQKMMQSVDPQLVNEMMKNIDPNQIKTMLNMPSPNIGQPPSTTKDVSLPPLTQAQMDEEQMAAMMMGMNMAQNFPKPELNEAQKTELQKAILENDFEKMMSFMPDQLKNQLNQLAKPEQNRK